jgi:hypothetical protein
VFATNCLPENLKAASRKAAKTPRKALNQDAGFNQHSFFD